jgi:phosphatidylglycerol:prolipoprotein diacylglycerol transferase
MSAVIHHNFDPIAFIIVGEPIPWYWLTYILGFFWCFGVALFLIRRGWSLLPRQTMGEYFAWAWIGTIAGARLGYIFLYNWGHYASHPMEVFNLFAGGMSFHGGLAGFVVVTVVFAKLTNQDPWRYGDVIATTIPWPIGMGRIANFLNGELPGRPTDGHWGVMFPPPFNDVPRHPSQLYEAVLEGVFLGIIMWLGRSNLRRPGIQSATFLIGYGLVRFVAEYFRMPDAQLGYLSLGLSMGQWLCLLLVVVGVCIRMRLRDGSH